MNFASRDFEALNDRLRRAAASVFPNWSDTSKANFGNILREMMAFSGDVLDKYMQAQAAESRFTTCTRRINGTRHARLIGYKFARQQAATVSVQFDIAGNYKAIPLEAGIFVRSQSATNPARFQLLAATSIPEGQASFSAIFENSETFTEGFESSDLGDQELLLSQSPFLEIVSISDAVGTFTEVDSFLDSEPGDAHFVVLLSDDDRALIRWGDGNQGRIPSGAVEVVYKIGGGDITVDKNTLEVPEFQLEDTDGTTVSFTVTNPAAAAGGAPRETLAEAQVRAPKTLRVNQRSVSQEDYSIVAEGVAGVARAIILTSDQLVGIAENYGQLYVAAQGTALASGAYPPATPPQTLLDAVELEIRQNFPSTITFSFDVLAAVFSPINISARVRLEQGAIAATVDAAIRVALAEYFAVVDANGNTIVESPGDLVGFGFEFKDELGLVDNRIPWSDLFHAILNVAGVRAIDEDTFEPFDATTVPLNTIPTLGSVTLINDRTGAALV